MWNTWGHRCFWMRKNMGGCFVRHNYGQTLSLFACRFQSIYSSRPLFFKNSMGKSFHVDVVRRWFWPFSDHFWLGFILAFLDIYCLLLWYEGCVYNLNIKIGTLLLILIFGKFIAWPMSDHSWFSCNSFNIWKECISDNLIKNFNNRRMVFRLI